MNSETVVNSYANSPQMLYGAHYVTLVSPSVSYENPKAKFAMPYVTPSTNVEDPFDNQLPKSSNNVVNKDNLGTIPITSSNYIELTVPRHLFYIKESVIVTNATPCICNLARGSGSAADFAAGVAQEVVAGIIDTATTEATGVTSPAVTDMPKTVNTTIKSFSKMAGPTAMEATKTGAASAAKVAAASKNGLAAIGTSLQAAGTGVANLVSMVDNKSGITGDILKANSVLNKLGAVSAVASKAMSIGRAAGSSSAAETLSIALSAAMDLATITSVIGVPGMPAITAMQVAGSILANASASNASIASAAMSAGLSLAELTKIGGAETTKITGMVRQLEGITKNISNITKDKKTNSVDKALGIAKTVSAFTKNTEINKITSVVDTAMNFAKIASAENARTSNLVSAAGGTAAEVARAVGASQVAELALKAGSKATDVLKVINAVTKKSPTIADIAEAAAVAAGVAAGSSASEAIRTGIKSGIDTAKSLENSAKAIAESFGGTASKINEAATETAKRSPAELKAKENSAKAAKQAQEEGKTLTEIAKQSGYVAMDTMKTELGSSVTVKDLAKNSGIAIMDTCKSLGLSDEQTQQKVEEILPTLFEESTETFDPSELELSLRFSYGMTFGLMETEKLLKTGGSPTSIGKTVGDLVANKIGELQGPYTGSSGTGTGGGVVNPGVAGSGSEESGTGTGGGVVNPGVAGSGNNDNTGSSGSSSGIGSTISPGPIAKPTQEQIDRGAERAKGGSEVASIATGKAGGTTDEVTQVSGEVAQIEMEKIPNIEPADVTKVTGEASSQTAGVMKATSDNIQKEAKKAENSAAKTASKEAMEKMEAGRSNPSFVGIGTCSPVVVHIRKEYYKGQKFIVINAGGNINIPQIIGVLEED